MKSSYVVKPIVFLACLVPMALVARDFLTGSIAGDLVKELEHRIGWWGLLLITGTLAITPLRRLTGWNVLQSYRRMIGLYGFFYISVHFLIYLLLDRELITPEAFSFGEVAKDIGERPYITVGVLGLLTMVPLALTSTKGWIRRLGKTWTKLHSLVYVTALAGVVHFMWSVKADTLRPTIIGSILIVLLLARVAPRAWLEAPRRALAGRVTVRGRSGGVPG